MKTPSFSKQQIEYLNSLYPEKCPAPSWSDREIWRYVGNREVVRHLNSVFEDQEKRALIKE